MKSSDHLGAAVLSAALAALVLAASPHFAAAATDGFFVGAALHSSHIGAQDPIDDPAPGSVFVDENGAGLSLSVGHGISTEVPIRLVLSGGEHKTTDPDVDFRMASLTLEIAYLFNGGQPLRPYLFGGVGVFAIESQRDALRFETTGPGGVFGGGLLYFVSEHFAFDLALRGELINWKRSRAELILPGGSAAVVQTPIEEKGSAAKFMFGGSVWF